jgi:hypothetical protein
VLKLQKENLIWKVGRPIVVEGLVDRKYPIPPFFIAFELVKEVV